MLGRLRMELHTLIMDVNNMKMTPKEMNTMMKKQKKDKMESKYPDSKFPSKKKPKK